MDQEQKPKQPENGSELFGNPEKMDDRTTDGCISRESTMLRVREFIGNPTYTEKMLVDDLNALPPVQPKPKTGRWIFDEILDRNYYCSECKSMGVDYWDYCPYCGCRMVEPQESEVKECK